MRVWRTRSTCRRIRCLRISGRLQRYFVIPIAKTPSAVLGESIARLRSDVSAKKKDVLSNKNRHYCQCGSIRDEPWCWPGGLRNVLGIDSVVRASASLPWWISSPPVLVIDCLSGKAPVSGLLGAQH